MNETFHYISYVDMDKKAEERVELFFSEPYKFLKCRYKRNIGEALKNYEEYLNVFREAQDGHYYIEEIYENENVKYKVHDLFNGLHKPIIHNNLRQVINWINSDSVVEEEE